MIFKYFLIFISINFIKSQTSFGFKSYTEFEYGNLNILISVPHDGTLLPNDIVDRVEEGGIVIDYNTRLFASQLKTELSGLFGQKPFMAYNNLHRRKLDTNRNPTECCSSASSNLDCKTAYQDYHNFINRYKNEMGAIYKQLIVIDLHGQSHAENWTEIGYLLTSSELNQPVLLETDESSVNALKTAGGYTLERMIRGDVSLGSFIQKHNYRVVPSPSIKSPGNGGYYNGGYTTAIHKSNNVNSIQIELAYGLRSTTNNVKKSAANIAKAIYEYYNFHKLYIKL